MQSWPALLVAVSLVGCGGETSSPADMAQAPDVELLAWFDLPRQTETESLSGTFYDEASRTLYAIKDDAPEIIPLTAAADFKSWTIGVPIALTGRSTSAWDGEGLTRTGAGEWLAVTVETQPLLERFSAAGAELGTISTPPRFAMQHAGNMGIESLSSSPSGRYLFFANEGSLTSDGPIASKSSGTRIRILRRDLGSQLDEEHAYLTDPCGDGTGGTLGVSDVTAVGDDAVLVLERGFQSGYGNTVRIYRADLSTGPDVSMIDTLDASVATVQKTLVVDLAALPSDGIPIGETQPNPILDNYEAMALGPLLPDGRRAVFVTSDDNARAEQVARILVLALRL